MAQTTKIEWADATWNPWMGCHKVSTGCKHCYMFRDMNKYGKDPNTVVKSKTTFEDPLKWKEPKRIFTCSWSDFLIEEADPWRDLAWEIMLNTPHTYLVLTKRAERLPYCLPDGYFPRNVWWGVSIENQEQMWRWDSLYATLSEYLPPVMFMSLEPLLGPIELPLFQMRTHHYPNWVIVGGESGPDFRWMDYSWVRHILDQCLMREIPFFMKQDSSIYSSNFDELPRDLRIRQFPGG